MSASRAATSPAVHDSATARCRPRARSSVEHELLERRSSSAKIASPSARAGPRRAARRAARAPARARIATSTSMRAAQIVVACRPVAAGAANARATADSPTP